MSALTAPSISYLVIRLAGSPWRGHLEGPNLDGGRLDTVVYLPFSGKVNLVSFQTSMTCFLLQNKVFEKCAEKVLFWINRLDIITNIIAGLK